jgi:hypothetical protein
MENVGLRGKVFARAINPDGTVKQEWGGTNTVCANGKTLVASRLINDITPGSPYDWIGIGSQDDAENVLHSGLIGEVYGRIGNTTVSGAQIGSLASFIGSFAITGAVTITEYGLFDRANLGAGSMFGRSSGTGIALVSGDFLEVTYQAQVG